MAAVTLEEVKEYLQLDDNEQDALLTTLIDAAILEVEAQTGLSLRITTGPYTAPVNVDDPVPLSPYTLNGAGDEYTTAITDKAAYLKTAIFLWVQGLFEADPKTIEISLDTARRICRLYRVNWGF